MKQNCDKRKEISQNIDKLKSTGKPNVSLIYIIITSAFLSELAVSFYLYIYINNYKYVMHNEIEEIIRDNFKKESLRSDVKTIVEYYITEVQKASTNIPPN